MSSTVNIPGPKGLPISGNLLAFRKDPLGFLVKAQREYGDVVHIRFGPSRHVYLISDPEYIKEVLVTKQNAFRKAKGLQTAKAVVGEGILTSEGEAHMLQRRLLQPSFRKDRIGRYAEVMVDYTDRMLQSWSLGETRIVTDDMMQLTLDIITHTMFGTSITSGVEEIGHAIEVGMKYVTHKASSIFDIPDMIPTRSNVEFKQAAKTLDEVIFGIIDQRRKHPEPGRGDLLSMLLDARDEETGTGMSNKQVRDEVMTIFLAGHETTANTLSWTWYLLSQHPETEKKFHEELDRVLGGRKPTHDDLNRLEYTQQIVWESMRIYPAVWAVNREVYEEVEIGGRTYTPGDTLMMSQFVMHRNPKYYEQAERFLPERFAGDMLKQIPAFAYFPFGGGPRVCIGNHFALMEATLLLATIGTRYQLRMAPDHRLVELEPLVTLRPKYGLKMVVSERKA
ncbi:MULTISPECIES: cytochrome P450 [unclassified Paenibacillus]|uniref:cytochrome P450 n=1 Tax=unclassified Paenibacillus TaxID=185978 RepID=UPI001AE5B6C5|nr:MULTISPECIES: cytochrome P450 [unclassified Paenibacillus]MBP1155921.1 cytochrome P450 [Paenibacillus sp. PvP091]MBP1168693.1 cytochrome P450 [Paenibacillus sp. PvR098]MBP2439721.1 cytochrome P450 [Paenibacillus sp. PvP052]